MKAGIAMLSVLGLLAGCGSGDAPKASSQKASTPQATARQENGARNQDATAAQVAAEARGKLKCPAKVTLAPRAANAPVDDIVGVRPGMTYEEAAHVVQCTHELLVVTEDARNRFQINTYGQRLRQGFGAGFAQARAHVQKTARDYARELQYREPSRAAAQVAPRSHPLRCSPSGMPPAHFAGRPRGLALTGADHSSAGA